jgi:hypothetical protein
MSALTWRRTPSSRDHNLHADDPALILAARAGGTAVTVGACTGNPTYTLLATPSLAGSTGQRLFFSDQSGVIRFTSYGNDPDCFQLGIAVPDRSMAVSTKSAMYFCSAVSSG